MNGLIQLDLTDVTPEAVHELSKSLVYKSYRYNRRSHPEIPYKDWGLIFDNVAALEAKLRAERN